MSSGLREVYVNHSRVYYGSIHIPAAVEYKSAVTLPHHAILIDAGAYDTNISVLRTV